MRSMTKKIVYTIIGGLLLSYLLFSWINFSNEQVSLFNNKVVTTFIIEHIFALCHIMGLALFILGLAALFKTIIYMKRETYERQNLRQR